LSDRVSEPIQQVFSGASLCALNKKNGGIRRLQSSTSVSKSILQYAVRAKMSAAFYPMQLGFGIPRATEAAAHAARCYIQHLQPRYGILKLDFSKAFNSSVT